MSKKNYIKKIVSGLLVVFVLVTTSFCFANAKTLAQCFTSGSNLKQTSEDTLTGFTNRYYKQAWGKITEYGSPHYVRAYVGNCDSGRVYSKSPHKTTTAKSGYFDCGTGQAGLLTRQTTISYAKYGNA